MQAFAKARDPIPQTRGPNLNVAYIAMVFPEPSETFASNDVRVLWRAGVNVSVHSLRAAHKASARMLEERSLTAIPLTHGDTAAVKRGLKTGLVRPGLLLDLLAWIVRWNWKKPEHLVKSLVLAPPAIDIFTHLERERPEVVHLYWGHYPSLVGHLVQSYLPETVVSISLSAYDLELAYGGSAPVAQKADMVSTWAGVNVKQIAEACGVSEARVSVIYQGVTLDRFADLKLTKTKRRIVTAGRLIPSKGTADVLRVFSNVLKRWPDASLVVLGDGTERGRLQALAQSLKIDHAVTFRGHVSHDEVFEEMAKAEVFLFMSEKSSERLPNVVKEAMGCRCVCIVTHTPGMEELLYDGLHGYIVSQGDVATASSCVEQVFSNDGVEKAMTDRAYEHLEKTFDINHVMAQFQARWQQLLTSKRLRQPKRAAKNIKSS